MTKTPAFVHASHAKAGSTWVDGILRALFGQQVAPRFGSDMTHFKFEPGRIYSSVFAARPVVLSNPRLGALPRFVVLRDLRDTVVSKYYSVKISHQLDAGGVMARQRAVLNDLSPEDGLLWVIENGTQGIAAIQQSWLGHGEKIYQYEELIANDVPLFRRIVEELGIRIDPARLEQAVVSQRFEAVYQRPMGVADPASHGRQGTPGDWKNHFTPKHRAVFHARFGDLLMATGYEPDASWVNSEK